MTLYCVYVTVGDVAEARRIGRSVVEARLAACANVIGGIQSTYWWDGQVQEAAEAVLILKTTRERLAALMAQVRALHSYECPAIEAWPIADGNPGFLAWVERETQSAGDPAQHSGG